MHLRCVLSETGYWLVVFIAEIEAFSIVSGKICLSWRFSSRESQPFTEQCCRPLSLSAFFGLLISLVQLRFLFILVPGKRPGRFYRSRRGSYQFRQFFQHLPNVKTIEQGYDF